jgi:hypothetical protein
MLETLQIRNVVALQSALRAQRPTAPTAKSTAFEHEHEAA